ncbi:MAG: zinc ribbon domain-containing protein [Gemmatimonadaceae bacterium]
MNPIVVTAVIALVAFAFVLAPLLRRKSSGTRSASLTVAESRSEVRDAVADPMPNALDELELDRDMGKLSAEDYERLREAISTASATALASLPDSNIVTHVAETASAASHHASRAEANDTDVRFDAEAERLIDEARAQLVYCPTCGERPEPGATYCSSCGRDLGGCPSCGATQPTSNAHFCVECGAALRT